MDLSVLPERKNVGSFGLVVKLSVRYTNKQKQVKPRQCGLKS